MKGTEIRSAVAAMDSRQRNYLFASLVILSPVLGLVSLLMTDIAYTSVVIIAVIWLGMFAFALSEFGRSALFMLFGAPIVLGTLLFGFFFMSPRFPPPIVADLVKSSRPGKLTRNDDDAIAARFAQRFPVGSNQDTLISTLKWQGFSLADPPPKDCIPADRPLPDSLPPGTSICPADNWGRMFIYGWGDFACNQMLWVKWDADKLGKITRLKAGTYYGCL